MPSQQPTTLDESRTGTEANGRRSGAWRRLSLLLLATAIPWAVASAQSAGGPYVMRKFAVAAGGVSTAPQLRLTSTIGQIAGLQTGGTYRLIGGFHQPVAGASNRLFCDGFESSPCP